MTLEEARTAYQQALDEAEARWSEYTAVENQARALQVVHRKALDAVTAAERVYVDLVLAEAKAGR